MELTEAVQRIVRHHIFLILAMVVLGMLVPVALQSGKDPSYEATARVGFDAADTANPEEAKSRTDTATAIITSQGNVGFALEKADINRDLRDPINVAENHVSVQAIGTSSVLELSVTDKDPKIAMRMANALAGELVTLRTKAILGPSQEELTRLDGLIRVQDKAVADAPDGSVRADDARAELRDLQEARGALVLAMPAEPTVIDRATLPDKPEASGIKAQMAVGGLLGLAFGLALASVVEAVRPTIVSSDALARELSAPIVGRLPRAPQQARALGDTRLPVYLQLAAAGAGVDAIQLVAVGPPVDLPRLTRWLQAAVGPAPDIEAIDMQSATDALSLTSSALVPVGSDQRPPVGLVVVSPSVLPKSALTSIEHLVAMTQWPLIGIITYQRRRFARSVPPNDLSAPLVRKAVTSSSQQSASAS